MINSHTFPSSDKIPSEHEFPIVSSRAFANCLSFIFRHAEGMICQAENEDGILSKFIVYAEDGFIKMRYCEGTDNPPVGTWIWMHETKEDQITAATLAGEEVYDA